MNKVIDIVDIKKAKYLKFYVKGGFIYCVDIVTDEKVIVGVSDVKD